VGDWSFWGVFVAVVAVIIVLVLLVVVVFGIIGDGGVTEIMVVLLYYFQSLLYRMLPMKITSKVRNLHRF